MSYFSHRINFNLYINQASAEKVIKHIKASGSIMLYSYIIDFTGRGE